MNAGVLVPEVAPLYFLLTSAKALFDWADQAIAATQRKNVVGSLCRCRTE